MIDYDYMVVVMMMMMMMKMSQWMESGKLAVEKSISGTVNDGRWFTKSAFHLISTLEKIACSIQQTVC